MCIGKTNSHHRVIAKAVASIVCLLFMNMCSCIQPTNKTRPQNEDCEKNQSEDDVAFVYNYFPPNAEDFNETLTIGFLGAYGQAQVVLGALPLAVMDVNKAKGN